MDGQDTFVRSIPKFLRRPEEPYPEDPKFMTAGGAVAPAPAAVPPPVLARDPATGAHRRPYLPLTAEPESVADDYPRFQGPKSLRAAPARPHIMAVEPRPAEHPHQPVLLAAAPAPQDIFAEARGAIEELFGSQTREGSDDEDDSAFQVTLPRSVIRQIRILAAREGTTQRAIVLKALRLAGLSVPDGADIDRRIPAAKRRQHA